MIPDRLKKIVELLIDKTLEKKVIWNKTSGADAFKLQLSNGSYLTVSYDYGNYNTEYITINVFNDIGEIIERFDNENDQDDPTNELMYKFHKVARDSYFKVDETMDNLWSELSKKDIIGIKEDPQINKPHEDDDLPF